jgi:hypothetical protein
MQRQIELAFCVTKSWKSLYKCEEKGLSFGAGTGRLLTRKSQPKFKFNQLYYFF